MPEQDTASGNIKSGHYSGQGTGKEGACPYLENSKGKELLSIKGHEGKEHLPWKG